MIPPIAMTPKKVDTTNRTKKPVHLYLSGMKRGKVGSDNERVWRKRCWWWLWGVKNGWRREREDEESNGLPVDRGRGRTVDVLNLDRRVKRGEVDALEIGRDDETRDWRAAAGSASRWGIWWKRPAAVMAIEPREPNIVKGTKFDPVATRGGWVDS
jgi:hypothetical protein